MDLYSRIFYFKNVCIVIFHNNLIIEYRVIAMKEGSV